MPGGPGKWQSGWSGEKVGQPGVVVGVRLECCDVKFGLIVGGKWKAWEGSEQEVM